MPYVNALDGTRLYYEESGRGRPVVFVHEFAGDYRTWELQIRALCRQYRCVTFSARGYPPSDIPRDGLHYSQDLARQDVIALMDHLGIGQAHVVGHSMGAYTTLHVGLLHPERCLSLTATGCGFASHPAQRAASLELIERNADLFAREDIQVAARHYADAPNRQAFKRKDPRGYAEFVSRLAEHSGLGSALTLLGVQRRRPTLWEMQSELSRLGLPLLVISGDEDEDCLDAGLLLKRIVPRAALAIMPCSGHCLPVEEPAAFNAALADFFTTVDAGRWMVAAE